MKTKMLHYTKPFRSQAIHVVWLLTCLAGGRIGLQGHPAKFHEKVPGKIQVGHVVAFSGDHLELNNAEMSLGPDLKVTRVERKATPRDLEEFVFVEYSGGELTELPPWFPRDFNIGETSAAGVLRRSRQNPDLHFIQANRRMFRLPADRDFAVWKHVELEKVPELEIGQKVLIIFEEKVGHGMAGALCLFPTELKKASPKE